mmetsp:Transcript_23616/g.36329  ORF Transcript_23616/g.36329 Transcript_23616/m.36329 type:complete len:102 (+) Transcript_23616:292-597(+)
MTELDCTLSEKVGTVDQTLSDGPRLWLYLFANTSIDFCCFRMFFLDESSSSSHTHAESFTLILFHGKHQSQKARKMLFFFVSSLGLGHCSSENISQSQHRS